MLLKAESCGQHGHGSHERCERQLEIVEESETDDEGEQHRQRQRKAFGYIVGMLDLGQNGFQRAPLKLGTMDTYDQSGQETTNTLNKDNDPDQAVEPSEEVTCGVLYEGLRVKRLSDGLA